MTERTGLKILRIFLIIALYIACPSALAGDQGAFLKLQSSRDALMSQEREIKRAYDETSRQIDELKQKQALLDSYLHQTDHAITDVERAMTATQ